MKKLLVAAGLAGVAYYLKKNPKLMSDAKSYAMQYLNQVKGKARNLYEEKI